MDFSVKGLTFNQDELVTISLQEIEVNKISRYHFFHIIGSGRKCFLLLRAGELITSEFIEKYQSKGFESLYALEVATLESIAVYSGLWKQLAGVTSQAKQIELKDEILLRFMRENNSESLNSILSFVMSCFEEFFHLPFDMISKYQNTSYLMFTRGLILSSYTTVSSMAHGIADYHFLKDFFNTALFLDYGLIEFNNFNFSISSACEIEREKPGQGISFLEKQNRPSSEIQLFRDHPNKSVRALSEHKNKFFNPEIIELIRFHHEKADGSGFPEELYYSGLSQTEMLLAFCDNLVPFEEHIFKKADGYTFVSMYFENLTKIVRGRMIPVTGVIESWKSIIAWNKKQEEKAS